jgi:hypothetical protein
VIEFRLTEREKERVGGNEREFGGGEKGFRVFPVSSTTTTVTNPNLASLIPLFSRL